jgi:hypothetical protein
MICVTMYSCMRKEIRILIFHVIHIVQTKGSIKYILNTYGGVMQSKKMLLNKPIATR